jgi:tRNA dimethylallyltransferase
MDDKYLVVIGGATAIGKSAACRILAKAFQSEILSADSRQVYQGMNIGTAKESLEALKEVPHHFIDHIAVTQPYSAGDFEREGLEKLQELFMDHSLLFLCGGSSMYIKALCEGLDHFPEVPEGIRDLYVTLYRAKGIKALADLLVKRDPEYAQKVDLQNPHRLIRALSVQEASGRPFSSFLTAHKPLRSFQILYFWLEVDRSLLYQRINERVELMMAQGLLEEVQNFYPQKHLKALQTVGYQELFEYLDGRCTLLEAVEKIKQNTRRYAKRQITWRRSEAHWININTQESDFIGQIRFKIQSMTGNS